MPTSSLVKQVSDLDNFLQPSAFSRLPANFYTHLQPTPLPQPYAIAVSTPVAAQFNLDPASLLTPRYVEAFTGNCNIPGANPLASVYSGHQFGTWAGQLGDGRAILLGDAIDKHQQRFEVQLKGAGPTPYSRSGDGRAVLRSSIRELLCSEAMQALGIPTSRALAITGSDQCVMREMVETSAVVTRLAPSFIRFGSFEHWYYNNRPDELKILADFVIRHHYPDALEQPNPYQAFLSTVTQKTAELVACWQSVGFMHGVMNTDNMSILGLTLDYGPFGFMEKYDERHICNHTDQQGRYSYRMQPTIGHWNTHALGQALLPLIGSVEDTQLALDCYSSSFTNKWEALLRKKLGLLTVQNGDKELTDQLFNIMQENHADFTHTFRYLSHLENYASSKDDDFVSLFSNSQAAIDWLELYRARLVSEGSKAEERQSRMRASNPKYVLRNYLAQIVIEKAQNKDFSEVQKLLTILEHPFDEQPEHHLYADEPPAWAQHLEISCSS